MRTIAGQAWHCGETARRHLAGFDHLPNIIASIVTGTYNLAAQP